MYPRTSILNGTSELVWLKLEQGKGKCDQNKNNCQGTYSTF